MDIKVKLDQSNYPMTANLKGASVVDEKSTLVLGEPVKHYCKSIYQSKSFQYYI